MSVDEEDIVAVVVVDFFVSLMPATNEVDLFDGSVVVVFDDAPVCEVAPVVDGAVVPADDEVGGFPPAVVPFEVLVVGVVAFVVACVWVETVAAVVCNSAAFSTYSRSTSLRHPAWQRQR